MQKMSPQPPGLHCLGLSSPALDLCLPRVASGPCAEPHQLFRVDRCDPEVYSKGGPQEASFTALLLFLQGQPCCSKQESQPNIFHLRSQGGNSRLYHCMVDIYTEVGIIQKKKSGYLDIQPWSKCMREGSRYQATGFPGSGKGGLGRKDPGA